MSRPHGILERLVSWAKAPVVVEQKSGTYSAAANATSDPVDIPLSKSGYTPLGAVGISTGAAGVVIQQMYNWDNNTLRLYLRNTTTTARNNVTVNVKVLYVKDITA